MKKHFLLLMMALFSLTGWAEDLTGNEGVIVAVSDLEYGAAAHQDGDIRVTLDGGEVGNAYWDRGGYYKKTGDTYTETTLASLNVGDECYLKINFTGPYSGYAYGYFSITQATLLVTIKTDAYFTLSYGQTYAEKPAVAANDVVATLHGNDIDEADYLNINATTLAAYTWEGNNNVNAGTYAITFAGVTPKDATNYKVEFADRNMDITRKAISAQNGFAVAIKQGTYDAQNGFTYTSAPQKPTYLVTWDDDNNQQTAAKSLEEGTDFYVVYLVDAKFSAANPTEQTFAQGTYFIKVENENNIDWYEKATTFVANLQYYEEDAQGNDGSLRIDSPINADDYDVVVWGNGNYDLGLVADGFSINKAPLSVMAIAQTKVYNGVAFDLTTAQFNIAGLVGDDQGKTVHNLAAATVAQNADLTNVVFNNEEVVGVQITVTSNTATLGEGNNAPLLSKNYAVTALPSTWKITQRPVTLTVANVNMTKGADAFPYVPQNGVYPNIDKALLEAGEGTQAAPVSAITVAEGYVTGGTEQVPTYTTAGDEGAINPTDKAMLYNAYNLKYANEPGDAQANPPVAAEPLANVTTANIEIKDYANAIKAVAVENYNGVGFSNYAVTINKGTLKVSGAAFNVMPVVKNQIEYSEEYTIGVYGYTNAGAEATIDASNAEFEIEKINEDGTKTPVSGLPTERGNYKVTIKEGTVTGTGNFANSTPTRVTGAFSIIKKTLDLNAFAQIVHTGDPITIIGENLVFANDTPYKEGKAPKSDENVTLIYSLTENKVTVDDDNKITGFAENVNGLGIIEVALDEDNAVNANYVIAANYAKGDLAISNQYDLELGGDEIADKIAAADENDSEEVSVTFAKGAVTMNEKEWYAMVFPFETTPAEIVSQLGTYVLVNKIKSSTMDEAGVVEVKFGLEWDKIEAGEPFLIKPAEAIDLGARVLYTAQTAAIYNATLNGHAIIGGAAPEDYNTKVGSAPANAQSLTEAEVNAYNATLVGAVAAGDETEDAIAVFENKTISSVIDPAVTEKATLTGTYEGGTVKWGYELDGTTADNDAKYRWLAHKEYKGDNNWKNPKSNAHTLAPMEAYLVLDPAATKARVYVEDIDENGTTAIKSLNADDVKGLNVEGMYTIGGMKLQGAPTQKGVYIKDGKKVIVK